MRSKVVLTLLAAGALSLGIVTGASAGNSTSEDLAPAVAFGPAEHDGVHNEGGGKPENPGAPGEGSGDHGKPEVTGKPADAGLRGPSDNASERAKAVVAAVHESHEAIRAHLDEIRAVPPGERGQRVSALMSEFGELFRLAGDAAGDESGDDT